MSLHLIASNPPSSIDDTTRRWVLTMWSTRRMDTAQIAAFAKLAEAQIYNIISNRKSGGAS